VASFYIETVAAFWIEINRMIELSQNFTHFAFPHSLGRYLIFELIDKVRPEAGVAWITKAKLWNNSHSIFGWGFVLEDLERLCISLEDGEATRKTTLPSGNVKNRCNRRGRT
jgi:hypothetical protein